MGKSRIGHRKEAEILESLGVDMIDESEVLTPADDEYHTDKRDFASPFVCARTRPPEALRRIREGAAMIRTKGEAGTGDVNQAVKHQRTIKTQIRTLTGLNHEERERSGPRTRRPPVTWSTRPPRPVASRSSTSRPAASRRPPTPR